MIAEGERHALLFQAFHAAVGAVDQLLLRQYV